MTITLNGTTGITTTGLTTTGNNVLGDSSSDTTNIGNGTLVTDSSGNVGIGTSSPKNNSGYTTLTLNNASNGGVLELTNNGTTISQIYNDASGAYISTASGKYLQLNAAGSTYISASTNGAERMRIDSSGRVQIGKTASNSLATIGIELQGNGTAFFTKTHADAGGAELYVNRLGVNGAAILFYKDTTEVGNIAVTGSATSYNSSSDYRLKENIAPMTGALAKVAQLNPVTYTWKVDGSSGQGFIAHELQAVVPDCVTGEKDAVETYIDEEGVEQTRPRYQGIDTSFLVATLTAAIQELNAKVEAQAAEIATLKGAA